MHLVRSILPRWIILSLLAASGSFVFAQNKTATLGDYYATLLEWEGNKPAVMIEAWPRELVAAIEADVAKAVAEGALIGFRYPLEQADSTNQSMGNQIERGVLPRIAEKLQHFKMTKCPGAGYPDWLVTRLADGLRMPLEIKATTHWDANDSNRRVLTSSSAKVRRQFTAPIHHLLLTILYKVEASSVAVIEGIRLDFLEPDTRVNVRLEASVNHRILSDGTHEKFILPKANP
ncbi:hypothetical protein [Geminisphaera colitermitum]|uniref:hypothetical protein n=1 Tax=Geminisphaera colitermitum TaxID=1148786 RepID=UPI000158D3C8|nr:hypothetical protein [Geminisphaera colitermitum]